MTISVAVLGCGMMGQEHVSYMEKYDELHVKFLCDPNIGSLETALSLMEKNEKPQVFTNEKELLERVTEFDLLVIATPNYLHTPQLLRWAHHPISILVEKPVAISEKQVNALRASSVSFRANIWVAMEYRYIPAIQKLIQMLPRIGPIKSISIRENRYPFLSKIDEWNKDIDKSGDTLVEKCCHFFDLFRLISNAEMHTCSTKIHRGLLSKHYGYHERRDNPVPIIDGAYVLLDFSPSMDTTIDTEDDGETKVCGETYASHDVNPLQQATLGCLELCMFAEGSRHQEEIVVTGMKGRLEAYLPENKVFFYQRPSDDEWRDRSKPPPTSSIKEEVFDCADLRQVYQFADEIPHHSGYHYSSTAIEWKYLIDSILSTQVGETFHPHVSLNDGISAVEMGIAAMKNITNKGEKEKTIQPIVAFSSKSSDHLLNLALEFAHQNRNLKVLKPTLTGIKYDIDIDY
mmetsp:Transcript_44663/g.65692  ORF Transcript_44663/g.65692 Transcript_44663/m.65692 type:complete len:460 (-) Transcript_44663:156-1535(-)|eukprot:CAMPEP_0195523356 /NCGR_PEP_ID=MMETSP0794_2-20130614/22428_1 /TAXON_ID=515487 /ORGANISM="Stephanopyxis turris, Strain CCMP 815" /LENGTH=459 /DNA_ID=CAMNT_0040653341 /DNA_START=142 /DNA_END=1521 /DNA_ORIENTATION=+